MTRYDCAFSTDRKCGVAIGEAAHKKGQRLSNITRQMFP
jgi:hypothetical protein